MSIVMDSVTMSGMAAAITGNCSIAWDIHSTQMWNKRDHPAAVTNPCLHNLVGS